MPSRRLGAAFWHTGRKKRTQEPEEQGDGAKQCACEHREERSRGEGLLTTPAKIPFLRKQRPRPDVEFPLILPAWSLFMRSGDAQLRDDYSVISRTTRQGLPTANTPSGMSLVTTLPAPMTAR